MSRFKLKPWQRRRLRRQLKAAEDARTYRRTLAVLELDRGRTAADVAAMLGVTRQSVHNWAAAFARDADPSVLTDRHRSGRPPALFEQTECVLRSLMPRSPQEFDYPDTDWTVPLLQRELGRSTGLLPSDETVRRGLHRLGYVWKRPRYVLDPDPEREKKTPHPAAHPGPAAAQRRAGRGRDRPAVAPAAAGRLVAEGRAGGGPHQRPECPEGDLRGDEPADRDPAAAAPAQGAGR
jgi:transposase